MRAFLPLLLVLVAFTSGHRFYDEFQNDFSSHSFNNRPMADSEGYYTYYSVNEKLKSKLQLKFPQILKEASTHFINEIEKELTELVEDFDLRIVKIVIKGKEIKEFFDILSKEFEEILEDVIPSIKIEISQMN